ncbi:hypothetical protein DV515_00010468 [Chloebia gouldiae]|uniref:Uncharacterized protein n=1 Tax=Chloebia gouldiae TaxID=44316 RepID=A0A3L8S964_CHLGU|nr:hypothetical protein DV515_00010468 [Chloebia gouldiae]
MLTYLLIQSKEAWESFSHSAPVEGGSGAGSGHGLAPIVVRWGEGLLCHSTTAQRNEGAEGCWEAEPLADGSSWAYRRAEPLPQLWGVVKHVQQEGSMPYPNSSSK